MFHDLERVRACLPELLDELQMQLVDAPRWSLPSDTSYLTDADRRDDDIMANVEAMAATNARVAWFGRCPDGFLGLWRGASDVPPEALPMEGLDLKGQYRVLAATLADIVAMHPFGDDFERRRALLVSSGLAVSETLEAAYRCIDTITDRPGRCRHERYDEARARRGLPAVPAPRRF